MADEITINITAQLANPSTGAAGALKSQFATGAVRFNQATAGMFETVVATSTTDTALTLSGITTPGCVMFMNLDATNNIDIGPTSGGAIVPIMTLKPRQAAVFFGKSTVAFRHQASAGTPKLQVKVWEA
jgi:hypothetical protein